MAKSDNLIRFEGYTSPNYTPVPDVLFDVQLAHLKGAELKVLLYLMRRTFGFKKDRDNVSLSQICSGITTRDGRVFDQGTGLSQSAVLLALKGLIAKNLIHATRRSSRERGYEATTYALNLGDRRLDARRDPSPKSVEGASPKTGEGLPREMGIQERDEQEDSNQETALSSNTRSTDANAETSGGRAERSHNLEGDSLTGPVHARHPGGEHPTCARPSKVGTTSGTPPTASAPTAERAQRTADSVTKARLVPLADILRPRVRDIRTGALEHVLERRNASVSAPQAGMVRPNREPAFAGHSGGHREGGKRARRKASPTVKAVLKEMSATFHDQAPRSSLTLAMNILADMRQRHPKLDDDDLERAFLSRLYEARSRVRQLGKVRKRTAEGVVNGMPFFFATLRQLLGMAPSSSTWDDRSPRPSNGTDRPR